MALDRKLRCAGLFIDLSTAFDTVNHSIPLNRLFNIGMNTKAVGWFKNYLSNRTQTVVDDSISSLSLEVKNGVPQGSILGPVFLPLKSTPLPLLLEKPRSTFMQTTLAYTVMPLPYLKQTNCYSSLVIHYRAPKQN